MTTGHHSGHMPTGDIFAGVSEAKMKYYFKDEYERRRKAKSRKRKGGWAKKQMGKRLLPVARKFFKKDKASKILKEGR